MKLAYSVCAIALCALAGAQQPDDEMRFAAVRHYWEWTSYLGVNGLDFPAGKYRAGSTFAATVFFDSVPNAVYWGFCSQVVRICQAYSAYDDGTIFSATGITMKEGETETAALKRFQEWDFADRPYPGLHPAFDIHLLHRTIGLPVLRLPTAVRQRVSNAKLEQAVREQLLDPSARTGCSIFIPYADEHTAEVPILTDCPKKSDINFARRSGSGDFYFTHGGYIEGTWGKVLVDRIAPRVRTNAALVLKEPALR